MPDKDPWDLGGGGESFPFDHIGDEVEGFVIDMDERQGSDMQTGEPEFWDKEKTRPVMITLVTLQTSLRDKPNDTGVRTVTLAGSKKPNPDGTKSRMCAVRTAVLEATGGTSMQFNGWLKMRFSSEGAKTKPGFNPPKYFEAWYRPPVMDLDGRDSTSPANQVASSPQSQTQPQFSQPADPNVASNWINPSTNAQPPVGSQGAAAGAAITRAQVAAISAAGMDPAAVFGADWESRVTS